MVTSIWTIDGILTGTSTLSQSRTGSHGNEGVLHISQTQWHKSNGEKENSLDIEFDFFLKVKLVGWLVFYGISTKEP